MSVPMEIQMPKTTLITMPAPRLKDSDPSPTRLRELADKTGLQRNEIARFLGVSPEHLSRYLSDTSDAEMPYEKQYMLTALSLAGPGIEARPCMTINDLADACGVHHSTVRRHYDNGLLPPEHRLPNGTQYWHMSDLKDYLETYGA